ncbi:S8 family peptidase [Ulvibacter antarcticus]|uniref:Putative secreted protein (Por secretion system target) n=1 Tax=Ulvibacter antarcticus TaxID=442714 RepID=A0A3L9YKK2_9FLAO|nr:S8 family peptidase [Ulvibacter antarcticus]RMA58528.1 putative secreted protein (Por secretion system target) [Ulvibacter antarcticus]
MKKLLLLLAVLSAPLMNAQEDALVYFADKENVAVSIANPISIMTQAAIDRKTLHGTPIDERDVPVNEDYVTQVKNASGVTVLAKSKWLNTVYVRGSQTNIQNLANLSFVTEIEFMDDSLNFTPIAGNPEDKFGMETPVSNIVYNYGAALNQTTMLAVDYLHEEDYTGEGILVAVLDNGFPGVMTNPAFSHVINENRLLGTYDFVEREVNADGTGSHGLNTSSDIAGLLVGGPSFAGTAPNASFYLFVTEDGNSETPAEEAYWVEALERSDSLGVRVVNTSLSYRDFDNSSYDYTYADMDGQTALGSRGGNHAFDKGMIMVNSAGNNGNSGSFPWMGSPADSPGVLTIGAVDSNGDYVGFSAKGPTADGRVKPDVMAQGLSAAVIETNGSVGSSSGTSFSSPIMAGAVASLWQLRPEVPNHMIMQVVRESAHLYNTPNNNMGYGIPNFFDAFQLLQVLGTEEQLLKEQFAVYPNPVVDKVNISFPKNVTTANFRLYNVIGKELINTTVSSENNSVDVSQLTSGMYIASISSEGKTNSFKLIKQ